MPKTKQLLDAPTARTKAETFPLFLHRNGSWCKKIRGRHRYFGTDKAEALQKYNREIGKLSQGQEPMAGDVGLRDLFNQYLSAHERARDAGKIGSRTLSDAVVTLRQSLAIMGDRLVSTLGPEDFSRLNVRLSKGRSPVTVSGDVRRVKAAFNWALREDVIQKLPKFGDEFKAAPARVIRLARSQRAALMFEPAELRALLEAADPRLRAMLYLGANCALLPIDLARLEFEEIDRDFKWLRQARHKTGIDRLASLWPETAEALKAAIAERSKPAHDQYRDLVFLTETGRAVVRTVTPARVLKDPIKPALDATPLNRVGTDFRKLPRKVGIYRAGRGFNALRHGFLTVAEAGKDFPAVARVMGHAVPGVTTHYREHISEDRIRAVCEIVRVWLFPPAVKKQKAK